MLVVLVVLASKPDIDLLESEEGKCLKTPPEADLKQRQEQAVDPEAQQKAQHQEGATVH